MTRYAKSEIRVIGCGMTAPEFSANHAHDLDCYRKASPSEIRTAVLSLEGVETVEWCEEHEASWSYSLSVLCDQKLRSLHFDAAEVPAELDGDCQKAARATVPLPEEEK